MSSLARFTAAASITTILGCGASNPPTATPGTEVTDHGSTQTVAGGAPIGADPSPVAAPPEVFAVGRIRSPAELFETASAWAETPMDVARMLEKKEPGVSRVLRMDAPIELVAAIDPSSTMSLDAFVVLSIGLQSIDAALAFAREKGDRVDELAPGVYGVGDDCVVAAAVGPASARLVCGPTDRDRTALVPYATRGLPNEPLSAADVYAEVRAEPFRAQFGRQLLRARAVAVPGILNELQLGDARFDRALADTVHSLADELMAVIDDVDRLRLETTIDRSAQMGTMNVSFSMRGKKSWVSSTLAGLSPRARPAPEIFWQLPKDASSATFSVAPDPRAYQKILDTGVELLDGALGAKQVPPRVRGDVVGLAKKLFVSDAMSAYAAGTLPLDVRALAKLNAADRRREGARLAVGWHVLGVEEPVTRWKDPLSQAEKVWNSRDLRTFLEKEGVPVKKVPQLHRSAMRSLGADAIRWELVLPGDSFDAWGNDGKEVKGKPLSVHLVIMTDSGRTWLGLSADLGALEKRLAQVKGSAAGAEKVGAREGLATLRSAKAVSGGYMTLEGVVGSMLRSTLLTSGDDATEMERVLASLPNHGQTPILTMTQVTDGPGPTLSVRFDVPRAVVKDIVVGSTRFFDGEGGGGFVPMPMPAPPPPVPKHR